ncbi:MAG: Fic family protein [Spartobacteria bacterium]|nr:Fic family protein [Spartobacteria bacterium]
MSVSWYLSDLGKAQGLQELFARQSPQRLKALKEHAIAQSAVSSNRIEGVEIAPARVGTVVFGHSGLKNRDEEEVAGYRDALNWIHSDPSNVPVTEETILQLHRLSRGNVWDAGRYKDKPVDIIEKLPGGGERVRFRSVSPAETPDCTRRLAALWQEQSRERDVSPLIVLAAFNLDFLCIHPFRDGNGRVSRLLLLLTAYHLGVEVGRYISLERLIEENKERYYETLQQSSQGWHEGRHNPWPYVGYLLFILKKAYDEFAERAGTTSSPKGEKTELVLEAIRRCSGPFRLVDVEKACPGVGRDWIQSLLSEWKAKGDVTCAGRGPAARWQLVKNKGSTSK